MTFYFPDLSVNNAVQIQANTAMVCAKKTHGSAYLDGRYTNFKSQAANKGSHFFGYHWLNHGSIQAQANLCAKYDVSSVPMMIDAEDKPGNTGYTGTLTVGDIIGFTIAYRKLGGIVHLCYLPHWYWQEMGSPDLTPLKNAGLHLVSSNYTSYSDSGPGWQSYGGMTPEQWQYTNALSYGGGKVDFNAVKNYTIDEWWQIIKGDDMALSDADKQWIVTTIKGGMGGLTTDELQQWLGDGVDGRNTPATSIAPRGNLKSVMDKLDTLNMGGGLSDADRTLINNLKTSIDTLAQQMAKIFKASS